MSKTKKGEEVPPSLEFTNVKIEIKLFANLKKLLPPHAEGSAATIEVEDGLTVAGLIELLQIPKEMAQLVLVNGINIEGEYSRIIQEGDTVSVFPPVAGGIDYLLNPDKAPST